jgi:hypothetical protein
MSHNLVKIVQLALLDNGGPVLSNEDARAAVVAVLTGIEQGFIEDKSATLFTEYFAKFKAQIEGQQ